jgi:outer membrane protein assembly factor BamD
MFRKLALISLLGSSALLITSCGKMTPQEKMREAQKMYIEGMKDYSKGDYSAAAEELREAEKYMAYLTPEQIKKLKWTIAMALYKDEKYEDAILELEDYIQYYPTASNIEEAYFYLINAYLKISPDPWRDQNYSYKAIEIAKEFFKKFPNSKYRSQIEELVDRARRKIAEHEYLIAKFYEDYGYYYPAAVRFENLLVSYSDYINPQEVLFHYIKNLYLVPKYAEKKKKYFREKYKEDEELLKKAKEKKPIKNRLKFYAQQIKRWENIAEESLKKADENLKIYLQTYGKDKNYELLLKIKKGEWKESWIEKIF